VALKEIKIQPSEEGVPLSTIREISMLKQIDKYEHPNIVRYELKFSILMLKSSSGWPSYRAVVSFLNPRPDIPLSDIE
jgi:hypothetical protein